MAFIQAGKFRRYHGESFISHIFDIKTLALNVRDFFRVILSTGRSLRILRKTRPDVVFSKGGFVAVPVGIAAHLLRIPIVTHDSDSVPGLANRIVGRWAMLHAVGAQAGDYPYPKESLVYTGIPLLPQIKPVSRTEQAQLKSQLGLRPTASVLFVASGGNGSRTLNNLVVQAAPTLLASNPELQIFHLTGNQHLTEVKQAYHAILESQQLKRVTILGFSSEFYKLSGAADLIISRAGATSLSEYALQAKACIIIPSPFLAGGHQLKNIEQLVKQDAVVSIDNDARADELVGVVGELLRDEPRRRELASNLAATAQPQAAQKLSSLILDLAKRN